MIIDESNVHQAININNFENGQHVEFAEQNCSTPSTESQSKSHEPTSVSDDFPFKRIHTHCASCIKPLKCIRKPNFALITTSTNQNGSHAQPTPQLSSEEIYSMILNVNYYKNGYLLRWNDVNSPGDAGAHNKDNDSLEYCPVVQCPHDCCDVILHYCKLPEHYLLCQYQKINCLNHTYGCPYQILRKDIASHLKHCPANVVHCSMEWNRWPLHTTEKSPQTRVYCPPQALDIRNLDVALALRDQRMLKQLWSASRQMKRIMRGCLSTHPAVPIKPYIGVRTYREYGNLINADPNSTPGEGLDGAKPTQVIIHCDEERYITFASNLVEAAYRDSLVEILKRTALIYRKAYDHQRMLVATGQVQAYQGRKKSNSVCQMNSSLVNGMLPPALMPITSMPSSSSINLPIFSDSVIQSALEQMGNGSTLEESMSGISINGPPAPPPPPPVPKCNALSLEISIRSLAAYHPKPRAMYTFRCGMDFRVDEYAGHHRDIHSDIHGGLDGWIEHRCPLFQYGCTFVHRRWAPTTCGVRKTLVYNENLEAFACSSVDLAVSEENETVTPMSKSPTMNRKRGSSSTSLDPDSTSSRRSSSQSTTTCCSSTGQWNSSKKYCSTLSLLSSNCTSALTTSPLSSPCSPCSTASSPVSASCSKLCRGHIHIHSSHSPTTYQSYSLNDFPFEILQHICNYLDGYSLNNLSFTTRRFRLVVQSFLKKKGFVVLQWKRYENEKGKHQWSVSHKKWQFSTAIEPITGWTLDADNVMGEHLRLCPFNDRLIRTEPIKCMFSDPADSCTAAVMKRHRP